jgi:hypothetical protein
MVFALQNRCGLGWWSVRAFSLLASDGLEVLRPALIYRVELCSNPSFFSEGEMANGVRSGSSLILDWPRTDDDRARNDLNMSIYQELRNVVARMIRKEVWCHPLTSHAIVHAAAMGVMLDGFALAVDESVLTVERHRRLARAWLDRQDSDWRSQ